MADYRSPRGKGRPPGKSSGGPRPPGQGGYRSSGGQGRGPGGGRPQGGKPQGGRPARFEPAGPKGKDKGEADRGERLQKALAQAGVGSRRACEEYIKQGRVTVDGKTVRELGVRVDPMKANIALDGERVRLERAVYFAVNKPKGYVSTNDDPAGRPRVVDILAEVPERVYTVGRLDEESTGLMILTNDGELANRLAHPRYGVEKLYRAVVAGAPSPDVLKQLEEGVWLSDGKARAKRVRIVGGRGESTTLELALAEGKNREVRRMLARFGHKVMSLTRIAIGPITLKGLPIGEFRPLNPAEIDLLHKVAAGIQIETPRFPARGRGVPPGKAPRPGQSRRPQDQHVPRSRRNESHERDDRGPRRGGRPPFQADQGDRPAPPGHSQIHGPRQAYGQSEGPERRPPHDARSRGPQGGGPGRPPGDRAPRQGPRPGVPGAPPTPAPRPRPTGSGAPPTPAPRPRPAGPGAPPRPGGRDRPPVGGPQRVTKPPPGLPPSQRRAAPPERPAPPGDDPIGGRKIIGLPPRKAAPGGAPGGAGRGPNSRKRPTGKRVPPRKAFGIKRRKPGEEA